MIVTFAHLIHSASSLLADASALESSISALKNSILKLENEIDVLEGSGKFWEHLLPWFTGAVVIGLVGDVIAIWWERHEDIQDWRLGGIRLSPEYPNTTKFVLELVSCIAIFLGVAGELGIGVEITVINGQLRDKNATLRSTSDQLVALVEQEAGSAADSAARAKADVAAVGERAEELTLHLEDLNRSEDTLAQKTSDLQRWAGNRLPSVSGTTKESLSKYQGLVTFDAENPEDEEQAKVASLLMRHFVGIRGLSFNTKIGKIFTEPTGDSEHHDFFAIEPRVGVAITCIRWGDLKISLKEENCLKVAHDIEDDLIGSYIAAVVEGPRSYMRNSGPVQTDGDLVIQIWPKPTFDQTKSIIDAYRANRKKEPSPKKPQSTMVTARFACGNRTAPLPVWSRSSGKRPPMHFMQ